MYIIVFLSIIIAFCSCAPATVSNQPCGSTSSKFINEYTAYPAIKGTCPNFIWPLKGKVVSNFGANTNHIPNKGINIKAKHGENVVASESGKAIFASYLKGWGKTLIIQHSSGFYSVYANLDDVTVKEGFSVQKGESVGKVASAKNGEGVLHFEIRRKHLADNPMRYLKYN